MSIDSFALLGLPRRFDLTPEQIESAYLRRAMAVHPDLLGPDEPPPSLDAARLNAARDQLADLEGRANLLLTLMGGPTKEQDKSLPAGFLMEMMEVRETIEAEQADPALAAKWRGWAQAKRAELSSQVSALFASSGATSGASVEPATLKEIRIALNAWRYFERLIEQLDPSMSESSKH
jgi:molecular chaperone HscB